jgi:hypothetical protein
VAAGALVAVGVCVVPPTGPCGGEARLTSMCDLSAMAAMPAISSKAMTAMPGAMRRRARLCLGLVAGTPAAAGRVRGASGGSVVAAAASSFRVAAGIARVVRPLGLASGPARTAAPTPLVLASCIVLAPMAAARSASAKAATDGNRSVGCLANECRMTSSTEGAMEGLRA